jgi:hypothetical protein
VTGAAVQQETLPAHKGREVSTSALSDVVAAAAPFKTLAKQSMPLIYMGFLSFK